MRVDPGYVSGLVGSLDLSTAREQMLSTELSSGLRVTALGDDPVAVAESSMLDTAISKADTFVQSASREESMLQVADSVLGETVTQLTSATSLAVQGANGTLDAANLKTIAGQLTSIRDQVLTLANTSYLGQYLFAGSQGGTKPYSLDASVTPAAAAYAGDASVQSIETPQGQKIALNLPGSAVFSGGTADVLGALNRLIADFSGGAAGAGTAADIGALNAGMQGMSTQRGVLGNSLNALVSASTLTQTEATEATARQSSLVSSNTAQVATDLRTVETQHQALLSVMSVLGKGSLFDFVR